MKRMQYEDPATGKVYFVDRSVVYGWRTWIRVGKRELPAVAPRLAKTKGTRREAQQVLDEYAREFDLVPAGEYHG